MRKVKYIYDEDLFYDLVINKVYDVVKYICDEDYIHRDMVVIIDDDKECTYFFYDGSNLQPLFEDVTLEYRSEIIDDILC